RIRERQLKDLSAGGRDLGAIRILAVGGGAPTNERVPVRQTLGIATGPGGDGVRRNVLPDVSSHFVDFIELVLMDLRGARAVGRAVIEQNIVAVGQPVEIVPGKLTSGFLRSNARERELVEC